MNSCGHKKQFSDNHNPVSVDPVSVPLLKRITDILISIFVFILCFPLFILIVFIIKITGILNPGDNGPIFRHEIRVSEGKPFKFYKFRFIKQDLLEGESFSRIRDRNKTLEKDDYATFIGTYLKKWYLDELPQLYNILRGDMSWVGPRPFHINDYSEDIKKGDFRKKVIRAGLSGLVQIHKGDPRGYSDVALDNEYIRICRSSGPVKLWFYDLGVILKTFKVIIQGKGL